MIDIKVLRNNPDLVRTSLANRKATIDLQEILDLDQRRRDIIFELDEYKKQRNENSGKIGKGKIEAEEKARLIETTRELGEKIKTGDARIRELEETIHQRMLTIPNILHESTPLG
ncbi:MAG: serine--tRNA ligase, partial [Proteobacteria bacterium]|nr:serine--tRNA ligase [Pseudomonadota bacterium]